MDETALDRALRRVAEARAGRFDSAHVEAAIERSRTQVQALAGIAEELEHSLPGRVEQAVQEGLRREVASVGRQLAEIRGLVNQANRRLERIEQELVADRASRLDDLEILVDLVSSGWRAVDRRLDAFEQHEFPRGRTLEPDLSFLAEPALAEPISALAS